MSDPKLVTCLSCSWVMFEYRRTEAENAVRRFNEFLDKANDATLRMYLPLEELRKPEEKQDLTKVRRSKIENYEHCMSCGGSYKNFRDFEPKDLQGTGHTINPIIPRDE